MDFHSSNDAINDVVVHTELSEAQEQPGVIPESRPSYIPKSQRGLGPSDPLPGAYNIQHRATGERPVWIEQEDTENVLESCHDSSSTRSEANIAVHENDESCIVIAAAELSKPLGDPMLIEGKKVKTKRSRLFLLLGFLVLVIFVAGIAAVVATKIISSASTDPVQDTLVPTSAPIEMRFGWTIADDIVNTSKNGVGISLTAAESGLWFLQSVLNRSDTNLTFFQVSQSANLLDRVTPSLINKFISPSWFGHAINVLKNVVLEGLALDLDDIHDGMVLTSMAGYPLTFQSNPFQVSNVTISTTSNNRHYKNGVVHTILEYPEPLVPWLGKSILDILHATNNERNGDLSTFIALIAITPDFYLLQETDSNTATTLFVPINEALAVWHLTLIDQGQENNNTLIQQLVHNHIVNGNFVKSNWQKIPTGIPLSNNKLRLDSIAGQSLDVLIHDDGVTINGNVKIIQGDLFSEFGVIHVIDNVL